MDRSWDVSFVAYLNLGHAVGKCELCVLRAVSTASWLNHEMLLLLLI